MNFRKSPFVHLLPWVTVLCMGAPLLADSPQFRGPAANGVFEGDLHIPVEWDEEMHIRWKIEAIGRGWSSPVILGDRIFITTAVEQEEANHKETVDPEPPAEGGLDRVFSWEVHCLDRATGQLVWRKVAHHGHPRIPTHRSNTYASETPVTDGEYLYVYFGSIGVFCYDLQGELLWRRDLGAREMKRGWGTASSPALHEDHLFVLVDSEDDSFLVALRTSDGEEVWRVDRPDEPSNWSSPVIWENNVRTELVVGGAVIRSHDPRTGDLLWELNTYGGETSASPCGNLERMVVGTEFSRARRGRPAREGVLCSVKPGATGDITPKEGERTSPGLHWFRPQGGPEMASPLIYDGYVYVAQRSSLLNCYDARTGERTYEDMRVEDGRPFWASPWAHDGLVYCLDESGSTHVIKPGDEYEVVAVNKLDDQFWASPALSEGTLILRGVKSIYCIGK